MMDLFYCKEKTLIQTLSPSVDWAVALVVKVIYINDFRLENIISNNTTNVASIHTCRLRSFSGFSFATVLILPSAGSGLPL